MPKHRQSLGASRSQHLDIAGWYLAVVREQIGKAKRGRRGCRDRMLSIMSAGSALHAARESFFSAGVDVDAEVDRHGQKWHRLFRQYAELRNDLLDRCVK